VIVSVYGPTVNVEVPTELPLCPAVRVLGLELVAPAAIVTVPAFCPDSVIVAELVAL
jgi:hypothetical protein